MILCLLSKICIFVWIEFLFYKMYNASEQAFVLKYIYAQMAQSGGQNLISTCRTFVNGIDASFKHFGCWSGFFWPNIANRCTFGAHLYQNANWHNWSVHFLKIQGLQYLYNHNVSNILSVFLFTWNWSWLVVSCCWHLLVLVF